MMALPCRRSVTLISTEPPLRRRNLPQARLAHHTLYTGAFLCLLDLDTMPFGHHVCLPPVPFEPSCSRAADKLGTLPLS